MSLCPSIWDISQIPVGVSSNDGELRGEKDTGSRSGLSHQPLDCHSELAGTGSRWQQYTDCSLAVSKHVTAIWDMASFFHWADYFSWDQQTTPLLGRQCAAWFGKHLGKLFPRQS